MKPTLIVLLLIPLFFLGACQTGSGGGSSPVAAQAVEQAQNLPFEPAQLGSHSLKLMIARTYEEKRVGLMFRQQLAPDEGMLFVYDEAVPMSFWMKNTRLALDIVFFSPDLIVTEDIQGMVPGYGVPEYQLPHYSTQGLAQYALELASGTVARLNIRPGDRLKIPLPLLFTGE